MDRSLWVVRGSPQGAREAKILPEEKPLGVEGDQTVNESAVPVKDRIRAKLAVALDPVSLDVIDDSHKHANHYVHPGGAGHQGETHFTVKIVSQAFSGKSRVQRHRAINDLLAEEIAGGVHALAIHAKAPGE